MMASEAFSEARRALEAQVEERLRHWDERAEEAQVRSRRWESVRALLPPAAALLLSVQILVFPQRSAVSIVLIGAELAVLFVALLLGYARQTPPAEKWIDARMRAEVLRREQFLVTAMVGPYLQCTTEDQLATTVQTRLDSIGDPARDPMEFVELSDEAGIPWRDALEDARQEQLRAGEPYPLQICPTPTKPWERYLTARLKGQIDYYERRSERWFGLDNRCEGWRRGILGAAAIAAGMHFAALWLSSPADQSSFRLVIEILAIVLPPTSSAVEALQGLYQGRRLGCLYRDVAAGLSKLAPQFTTLIAQVPDGHADDDELAELDFAFRRLVLRAEELMTGEWRNWCVVMRP
ncbi:MAG: hypothetical protein U9R79_04745 [Armatimonadota bacterium]|nr:hypothetical protein [Armatimonadota bacterium]